MTAAALELDRVSKVFSPEVRALDTVDFALEYGEIQALCGENGAGKTTLAMIAAGRLAPTAGSVRVRGPVGLVHQHFELVERLRVWENVVLGRELVIAGRLDAAAARRRVRELAEAHGLFVEPDALVEDLSVGVAQRVELLRELAREPDVLILDEPTAVLAPAEVEALFTTLRSLAAAGTAVLVITHKLREVVAHADRVTVLRAGKIVARFDAPARVGIDEIARAMVGRATPPLAARASTHRAPRFTAEGLRAGSGAHALRGISFTVEAGEIVGIAGVEGNGQAALAGAISGVLPYDGAMRLGDELLPPCDSRARLARGLRTIPGDRQREGLVLEWPLSENAVLGDQRRAVLRRGWTLDRHAMTERAAEIVTRFDVRAPSIATRAKTLSGGNQQKFVAGRALSFDPRFLLAYQPTRGIDVAATTLVQSRLVEARNAGAAILLVSFELDEILALADRVLVLYRGAIAGAFPEGAHDRARIGALMAGA